MFGQRWTPREGVAREGKRKRGRACRTKLIATLAALVAAGFATSVPAAGASIHGIITTIAGSGSAGYGGDDGPATSAQLRYPPGVAVDHAGNTVIVDGSLRIRVAAVTSGTFYGLAMAAGDIYTVAGNGMFGYGGDGGPATSASLAYPQAAAVDDNGNIVVADTFAGKVRVVAASTGTFYGIAMTVGDIYTVAGSTFGVSGDGGPATQAQLDRPIGVAVDAQGDIAIADFVPNSVRVVAGETRTLFGVQMTAGDIYTVAGGNGAGFSGDGGPGTSAQLNFPDGLAFDGLGSLLVADSSNNRIRVLAGRNAHFYGLHMITGDIYTMAGDGTAGFAGDKGRATSAELNLPNGVSVDAAGDVLIADSLNNRVRAVATAYGNRYHVPMRPGKIYTVAGSSVSGFAGDGGPATSASLNFPAAVAVDANGDIVIADQSNNRVRMVAR